MHCPREQIVGFLGYSAQFVFVERIIAQHTMAEFLNINLDIAGKKYPLRIERAEEELYRKAEKEINRWVATIESRYRMDKEGCLAMAALQVALQNVEHATSRNIDDDLAELTAIERTLDDYLSKLE